MNEVACTGSSGALGVKFKCVCSALGEAACCNFQVVTFSLIIWKRMRPGTAVYSSFWALNSPHEEKSPKLP